MPLNSLKTISSEQCTLKIVYRIIIGVKIVSIRVLIHYIREVL